MRIFSALLIISVASTGAAVASPFEGTWDSSQEACALDMNDFRLTISGNTANYWESSCDMVQATNLRDMGTSVLYDLQCFGEGDTYSGGRVLFSITSRGQLLAYNQGQVALRERCK